MSDSTKAANGIVEHTTGKWPQYALMERHITEWVTPTCPAWRNVRSPSLTPTTYHLLTPPFLCQSHMAMLIAMKRAGHECARGDSQVAPASPSMHCPGHGSRQVSGPLFSVAPSGA